MMCPNMRIYWRTCLSRNPIPSWKSVYDIVPTCISQFTADSEDMPTEFHEYGGCRWLGPKFPNRYPSTLIIFYQCHMIRIVLHIYRINRSAYECRIYAPANSVSIGSDNGLPPDGRQAIIWTNSRELLTRPLGFKMQHFHLWKCIWKRRLRNGGHFSSGRRV